MTEAQFANRMLALCATVSEWMTTQIIDLPDTQEPCASESLVQSYLAQIRRMLDDIEKDADSDPFRELAPT